MPVRFTWSNLWNRPARSPPSLPPPSPRRRTLESPITAPGQQLHEQHQAAKEGAGAAHAGEREWGHSGRLGHTEIFVRPPRPTSKSGATGEATTAGAGARNTGSGGVEFSTAGALAAAVKAAPEGDDCDENSDRSGWGGSGEGASDWGGGKGRSEAEEAWSCCGKTVVSAGRGCEPREPLATVRALLLSFQGAHSTMPYVCTIC